MAMVDRKIILAVMAGLVPAIHAARL